MIRHRACRVPVVLGVLFLVTLGCGSALGQSHFAVRNIGQPLPLGDSRMAGRGGWGMAVTDSMHPGFKNLASLAGLKHVALSFTGYGEQNMNEDQRGERRTSRTMLPDVRVGIPLVKERLSLTGGFLVYRSTQFSTLTDTSWGDIWDDGDIVSGGILFRREGNKFRIPLGAAWKPVRRIAISGAYNIEAGSIREELTNFYDFPNLGTNSLGQLVPVYLTDIKETKDEYTGSSYTLGFILDPFSGFQLGGSWTPAHDIKVTRLVLHLGVAANYNPDITLEMPDEYMAGFQLGLGRRWRIGGDARFMEYSKFWGEGDWAKDMDDEYGYSVGLERERGQIRRGGASNLPFRLGYQQQFWAYRVGGSQIKEESISIGTGFAFRGNLGQLDLALSYGRIGDMEKNLMETKYWRFTLSVVGLERWW